jgi:hypothetical protein
MIVKDEAGVMPSPSLVRDTPWRHAAGRCDRRDAAHPQLSATSMTFY